ncbi:unnamed protein product [Owenia fusiformis]|uniref:Anoctamin n=1 Tax=Owenia fusiformis TaxID=6347 RepID=A0A8J1XIM6_OWEFU|nr:unnamed protein product [Owenia fusiformis]
MECLRTQSEYDDSLTLKLYMLQFVNYYSSIFYIAFFKGRFVGRPGDYNTLFGARQEECGQGGCLIELCIQLAIIMVGKQLIQNNIMEIIIPMMTRLACRIMRKETPEKKKGRTPWVKDYLLAQMDHRGLFFEYLEMLLQFGFITIFVAAFPLAPLFALLNNIMEIRCDASKFVTALRRPMAQRAQDIGMWYNLLFGISRLSILTNPLIIAFTSEFIPRMVYQLEYSKDGSLHGYINGSLAHFAVKDYPQDKMPDVVRSENMSIEAMECRYKDYRHPPWSSEKYEYTSQHWHVMAARLLFIAFFENLIVVTTSIIAWLIPDVPRKLQEQVKRESYVTNEIIIQTELERAHGRILGLSSLASSRRSMNSKNEEYTERTDLTTDNDNGEGIESDGANPNTVLIHRFPGQNGRVSPENEDTAV